MTYTQEQKDAALNWLDRNRANAPGGEIAIEACALTFVLPVSLIKRWVKERETAKAKPAKKTAVLSLKQQIFVTAYLGDANGNATEAARIAGYKNPRISGSENLTKPDISARIAERTASSAATADEVLAVLSSHMRGSIGDLMTDSGEFDWPKIKASRLVKSVKRSEKFGDEVTLHDAQSAAVHLGKYHKLFTDKTDITTDGKPLDALVKVITGVSMNDL